MAWLLEFDSTNDYVVAPLSHTYSGVITLEFNVIPLSGESVYNVICLFSDSGRGMGMNRNQYMIRAGGSFQIKSFNSPLPTDAISTVRFEIDTATDIMRVFVNNVEQASSGFVLADPVVSLTNFILGSRSPVVPASPWGGKIEYADLSDSTGPLIRLDSNASLHGTGSTIMVDTVAGNNGTGYGFPTDGSQWSEIGGGGSKVESSTAFNVGSPSFSSLVGATLPKPEAIGLLLIDKPLFNVGASVTMPNPQSVAAFDIKEPSFISFASATVPNPIANASFYIDLPVFSSNVSVSLPKPVSNVDFTINEVQFSSVASVTQPSYSSVVSFDVDSPGFLSSASATLPAPDSFGLFIIDEPVFSSYARVTGSGQDISNFTASFAGDLYSAEFKPSEITVNFKS